MLLRLITCYLFHLQNYKDIADAFRRLKYLKYHPKKFAKNYYTSAFILCLYQFWSAFMCESVNLIFLTR